MALADFPVAVSLNGERYVVICRDVSTASFLYEYPEADKADSDPRTAFLSTKRWMFNLLTRVAVDPRLSIEYVNSLDDGALDGCVAYCHAVGFITAEILAQQATVEGQIGDAARRYQQSLGALSEEILPATVETPRIFRDEHMPYIREIAPSWRAKIREIAVRTRTRPSAIWLSPISETMLDYRILFDANQKGVSHELTGDDALIGFED
jgi:hypothetical protein